MSKWIDLCAKDDVDQEDLITLSHEGRRYAIYQSPEGAFFCTDGLCTHEEVDLGNGLVMEHTIECPKHNGVFDYTTGEAKGAPVCVNLQTYEVRIVGDRVEAQIG